MKTTLLRMVRLKLIAPLRASLDRAQEKYERRAANGDDSFAARRPVIFGLRMLGLRERAEIERRAA